MGFEYKALIEWPKYMVFCCVSLKQKSFGSSFEFSLAAIYVAKERKRMRNVPFFLNAMNIIGFVTK